MKKILNLILVLLIIFSFTGCSKKDKETEKEEQNSSFTKVSLSEQLKEVNDYRMTIGSNEATFTKNDDNILVIANDKILFESGPFYELEDNVYAFGNELVYISSSTGTYSVNIFDFQSRFPNEYSNINTENYNLTVVKYDVQSSGITLEATALFDNNFTVDDGENIETVELNSCEVYNKYKDKIVYGTFKMEYNKETGLSEPVEVSHKKISDYIEYSDLCK